jgi:anti-sigma regulatory factor (Ser/Thr protein kinase)
MTLESAVHTEAVEGLLASEASTNGLGGFSHEALFYSGLEGFIASTVPFIRQGLEAGEPILVVVAAPKIEALRDELSSDARAVRFADMRAVGLNPARIIPAWHEFVRQTDGRSARGIGEPIWAERSPAELVEAQRHEALLNLAFHDSGDWRLLCPYDITTLDTAVLDEARRTHPALIADGAPTASATYMGLSAIGVPFAEPLPPAHPNAKQETFDVEDLTALRILVGETAAGFGMSHDKISDLVLAVNEVATNSLRHARGVGQLLMWLDGDVVISEIRDHGHIEEPLAGRTRPTPDAESGYGLWLANQLCDLVQIRMFPAGNVVRLHLAR